MIVNTLNIQSFQGEYTTGLIFSLLEGLKENHALKLISSENFEDFMNLLKESGLSNFKMQSAQNNSQQFEITIQKESALNSQKTGCCGMCGSHS